jgi:hypothetical protein
MTANLLRRKIQSTHRVELPEPSQAVLTLLSLSFLLDCFIHLPAQQGIPFQMDFQTISDAQLQDAALLQEAQVNPCKFSQQMLAPNIQVYCYTPQPGGA